MNIKNTICKIMYYIFTVLSIAGFCILGSIVDVAEDGFFELLLFIAGWFVCIGLAVLFYDYRIYTRIFFAASCVVLLIHGFIHRKHENLYRYLYDEARYTDTIFEFFFKMLNTYDELHPYRRVH